MRVAVVVPTYNEKDNVIPLVEAIKAVHIPNLTLLIVDDSSPDGTSNLVRKIGEDDSWVRLHQRPAKQGLGRAYLDGLNVALRTLDPDVLVVMDGDLQHPPETIKSLLRAIDDGAGMAIASRYVKGGGIIGWNTSRRMVSLGANLIVRILLRAPAKDCTTGFRAYRREAAEYLVSNVLPAKGFEFNVFSVKVVSLKMKVVEVPFTFRPRKFGQSKLKLRNIVDFLFAVVKLSTQTAVAPLRGY